MCVCVCVCVCGVCVCVQPASHSVYHTSGASEASSGVLYQAIVFFFGGYHTLGGSEAYSGALCQAIFVQG